MLDLSHDICCLHIPTNDTKIAQGFSTAWCCKCFRGFWTLVLGHKLIIVHSSSQLGHMLSPLDPSVSLRFPFRRRETLTLCKAQLGSEAREILPANFLDTQNSADIIKIISILVALWFWGLSMWFFLVSMGSLWKYLRTRKGMPFQMTWWSFVFPNTALVSTQAPCHNPPPMTLFHKPCLAHLFPPVLGHRNRNHGEYL